MALMESKIAEVESALAEARGRHLRLAADFDNFKKRTRQEQLETIQHASTDLIARVLPALDDLHKALDHKPEGVDEAWVKGLELSVRKLEEALAAHGLQPDSRPPAGRCAERERPDGRAVRRLGLRSGFFAVSKNV